MKPFVRILTLVLLIAPVVALGADNFVPLAPIPNLDTGSNATLGSYINSLFFLIISVAAMLAVIKVVIGGFQYMTQTSSTSATAKARETIRDAIIGLILLLSSYLILSIVNPQILSLESLRFSALGPSDTVQGAIQQNRADALKRQAEIEAGAKAFAENFTTTDIGGIVRTESVVDGTDLTESEKRQYLRACTQKNQGAIAEKKTSRTCENRTTKAIVNRVGALFCNSGEAAVGQKIYLYCTKPSGN